MTKDLKILIPQHVNESVIINGISTDSRKVEKGEVFVAIIGDQADGHNYLTQAVQNGASALIVSKPISTNISEDVIVLSVDDTSAVYADLCSAWFDVPSNKLKLVGITGTNGKTTVATLLYQACTALGFKCGLISTVEYKIHNQTFKSTHTTPDAYRFNQLLNEMANGGCEYVFAEVSSHAVAQKRIYSLHFVGAVFTNLTHDHLDYHGSFTEYRNAKKTFFDELQSTSFAIINSDDKNGRFMIQNCKAHIFNYSLRSKKEYSAKILEQNLLGQLLRINQNDLHIRLIGAFNVYNVLAVIGVLEQLGFETDQYLPVLSQIQGAKGRFQSIYNHTRNLVGIVDYAHTPDALENVLKTIQDINEKGRVIIIFGCGGDRDKTKRPKMGAIASTLSDIVIVTSDNPRTEDPQAIVEDILDGVPKNKSNSIFVNLDRYQAIKMGVQLAQDGDIVLVAGKGHEDYQILSSGKIHFDDYLILQECFTS